MPSVPGKLSAKSFGETLLFWPLIDFRRGPKAQSPKVRHQTPSELRAHQVCVLVTRGLLLPEEGNSTTTQLALERVFSQPLEALGKLSLLQLHQMSPELPRLVSSCLIPYRAPGPPSSVLYLFSGWGMDCSLLISEISISWLLRWLSQAMGTHSNSIRSGK